MRCPSAGVLYLIAAATFVVLGVLQLSTGRSDGWLSLLASGLLFNAARISLRPRHL